jgi:hypothetical protein
VPVALDIKPPVLGGERLERLLPGPISDVGVGGGGRFLILLLPRQRQLAIFDVNEAKVVKYLPVAEDEVKFAAGMEVLVVAAPEAGVLQRWNLRTFQKEVTVPLPVPGRVTDLCLGSASAGPLLLCQNGMAGQAGQGRFLDPVTFKVLERDGEANRSLPVVPGMISASADGSLFTINSQHLGYQVVTFDGKRMKVLQHRHHDHGPGIVSADGRFLCASSGVYNTDYKLIFPDQPSSYYWHPFVPAAQGNYFLQLDFTGQGITDARTVITGKVVFFLPGIKTPFATLPQVEGLFGGGLAAHRRVHFIADAQLLVTVGKTNDRLLLHHLDPTKELDRSGIDYLLVTSQPIRAATRGREYRYPLAVLSKNGGVNYRLEAGPKGMTISPTGELRWSVPADCASPDTDVLISLADKTGREAFHTFRLTIVPAGAAAPHGPP